MLLTHSIGQHRPGQLPTIPALIVLFFIFLFTIAALIHDPWIAYGGNPPGDRDPVQGQKILVLCSYGYSLPTYQKLNPALLVALKTGGVGTNDLFFEYLDLLHIHDGQQRLAVVDMLRAKYTKLGIDLVVSLHSPAMSLLLSDAADIFPGTPLVSWDMQAEFHEDDSTRRVFRTVTSLDVKGTLTWALELFPNAERVVFVSGGSEGDRLVEAAARRSLADWENKLQVEYLTNSSVEEILARVADLPPQSIVVYGSIFKDKTGRSFTPSDVGDRVAKAANAPVFCLYDTNIGRGMVGGSLLSFEAEGSRIGMFALNILRGELEETTAKTGKPVLMFDWQQIKRWGGNTSNLPEGTIFLNPPTSLWSQYAWHIIGFLFILLALLLLIGSLLVQRRHRKLAELELRVSNATLEQRVADRMVQLQEKEARYSSLFNSMTEGFALHEIIFGVDGKPVDYRFLEINPAFERLTGLSRETVIGKTIRQIMPEIEANWRVDTYSPVALDGIPVHIESYSVFLNHWYEVYAHQTTPGQFALFFTDITERKDTEEKLRQLSYFPEEDPNPVVRCTPEGSIMYTNVPAANWLATFDRQTGGFASLPEPVLSPITQNDGHFVQQVDGSLLIGPLNGALPRTPRFFKAWGQQIVGSAVSGIERGSPKAPFFSTTIRRPSGYPLAGCSSAEPTSVSPNL
jgi:PAS domain S-box-containing protein